MAEKRVSFIARKVRRGNGGKFVAAKPHDGTGNSDGSTDNGDSGDSGNGGSIDPAVAFGSPDSGSGGSDSGGASGSDSPAPVRKVGWPKGKPRGPRAQKTLAVKESRAQPSKASIRSLAANLDRIHNSLAIGVTMMGRKHLADSMRLHPSERDDLEQALRDYANTHDIKLLSDKRQAEVSLLVAVVSIYGRIGWAIASDQPMPPPQPPPEVTQPGPADAPVDLSNVGVAPAATSWFSPGNA